MPHEIHTSERRSFRGCRRRWDYAYRQGFVPDQTPRALAFGIAFHIGFEKFYDPELWESTTPAEKAANAVEAFVKSCEDQRTKYLFQTKQLDLTVEEREDFEQRIDLGTGMFAYYATHVHPKYDSWFKPVKVEIPFEVPIKNEDGTYLHCTNSPACGQSHSNDLDSPDSRVVYAGRIDMLVEDEQFGGYYIWDHKTAAALAANEEFLILDDQILSYCWGLGDLIGIDIKGFIYQEIRKAYPKPPPALKRHMGGRAYSTAKTNPTSMEVFEPFVAEHDKPAYEDGKYDEYMEFLRTDASAQFHQRFVIRKSEQELAATGINIAMEAADMVDSGLRIYPSPGKFSCSGCAYKQPCIAKARGEDEEYLLETTFSQTNRRYWMDQPRSSDKSTAK